MSHTIEVVYDGPDLDAVAAAAKLTRTAVIEAHAEPRYVALLTGFMPGFAYLGEVDERLVLPRLAQPRARVPAGAVGIAGTLTGVYPFASPGGWNLVGHAVDARLFEPDRSPPARIGVLDEVTFVPCEARAVAGVERNEGRAVVPRLDEGGVASDADVALVVEAVKGLATIQDRGRFHLRGRGIATSGPLDAETLDAANAAAGNSGGAAAIEVVMARAVFRAERAMWISVDGHEARRVEAGDRIVVDPGDALTAYLAVRGGVDVPEVLGSRATFIVARLGGLDGRALKAGDRLCVGPESHEANPVAASLVARAHPSGDRVPHLTARRAPEDERLIEGAFDALVAGRFTVSPVMDRVGVRLDGTKIARATEHRALPDPTLPGAIQVANDGTPIVLGPDSAVTGGYPIVAILDAPSRSLLGRLRPGTPVRIGEAPSS